MKTFLLYVLVMLAILLGVYLYRVLRGPQFLIVCWVSTAFLPRQLFCLLSLEFILNESICLLIFRQGMPC